MIGSTQGTTGLTREERSEPPLTATPVATAPPTPVPRLVPPTPAVSDTCVPFFKGHRKATDCKGFCNRHFVFWSLIIFAAIFGLVRPL